MLGLKLNHVSKRGAWKLLDNIYRCPCIIQLTQKDLEYWLTKNQKNIKLSTSGDANAHILLHMMWAPLQYIGKKKFMILIQSSTPWWRHNMETFSTSLAIFDGNPRMTVIFPNQRTSNAKLWYFFVVSLNKLLNNVSIWPLVTSLKWTLA